MLDDDHRVAVISQAVDDLQELFDVLEVQSRGGFIKQKKGCWCVFFLSAAGQVSGQFEAAERIAKNRQLSRQDVDEYACESQRRARFAWDEGRFGREVLAVDAPVLSDAGEATGDTRSVTTDQGLRATTVQGLAELPALVEDGWRAAVTLIALVGGAMMALGLLLVRNRRPDGNGAAATAQPVATGGVTLAQAVRMPAFYLLMAWLKDSPGRTWAASLVVLAGLFHTLASHHPPCLRPA